MKIIKYLVALASWKRYSGLRKEVGDPFYLVFAVGPRGGIRYIMAVPTEMIDKLGPKAIDQDYKIKTPYDVYGTVITSTVMAKELNFISVFREDLLEKILRS